MRGGLLFIEEGDTTLSEMIEKGYFYLLKHWMS